MDYDQDCNDFWCHCYILIMFGSGTDTILLLIFIFDMTTFKMTAMTSFHVRPPLAVSAR